MKRLLILTSIISLSLTSCDEIKFNECDCVKPTDKVLNHQGDHDWFMDLDKYCEKRGLGLKPRGGAYNEQKWNSVLQDCLKK